MGRKVGEVDSEVDDVVAYGLVVEGDVVAGKIANDETAGGEKKNEERRDCARVGSVVVLGRVAWQAMDARKLNGRQWGDEIGLQERKERKEAHSKPRMVY